MAWCRQSTSYYLRQWWPRPMSPYGVTRPQWVKLMPQPILSLMTYHLGLATFTWRHFHWKCSWNKYVKWVMTTHFKLQPYLPGKIKLMVMLNSTPGHQFSLLGWIINEDFFSFETLVINGISKPWIYWRFFSVVQGACSGHPGVLTLLQFHWSRHQEGHPGDGHSPNTPTP